MTSSTTPWTWTYSEYARFPDDGNRYEVIDGEVQVTPAPTPMHQFVLATLQRALWDYVERHGLGFVFYDVDVLFATGQFLRPDLVVVPADQRDGISDRGIEVPPALIVEVQSPTSSSIDRVKKPARYGDFGVPEYWVLDPAEGALYVWRFAEGVSEPERYADRFTWQPVGAPEPLHLDVKDLLRPF